MGKYINNAGYTQDFDTLNVDIINNLTDSIDVSGVKKRIKKYAINEVKEITLLSVAEWKEARKIPTVPKHINWWWLRSPSYDSYYSCYACDDGYIHDCCCVCSTNYGVRPTFRIPNLDSEIGDKIFVEDTICTVIDDGYVLSDSVICRHRFDDRTNDYEKSEIKAFLNSEEFKGML